MTPGSDFLWPEDGPELEVVDEVAPFGKEEFDRLLARDAFPPLEPTAADKFLEPKEENYVARGRLETTEQRVRQKRCLGVYGRWRGWTFEETEGFTKWDALMYDDGQVCEVVEFKGRGTSKRPVTHNMYAGRSYLREDKRGWVMAEAERRGVPAMALFEYDDGIFTIPMADVPLNDRHWQENANDGPCWVYRFPASMLRRLPDEQVESESARMDRETRDLEEERREEEAHAEREHEYEEEMRARDHEERRQEEEREMERQHNWLLD